MECGSCSEVLRRVAAIKALANEAEAEIRIGGVVDRDFLSDADGVLVLPVHEVENFFLHPATLAVLLQQNGRGDLVPLDLTRGAADRRAGSWIFQCAMGTPNANSLPNLSLGAKEQAKSLTWEQFEADQNAEIQGIVDASGYSADDPPKFQRILEISARSYSRKREQNEFWKVCEGKQVLNDVARSVGFADAPSMIQATFATWERESTQIPDELVEFREYLTSL